MSEHIIDVNTAEQYKKDYKLYALYVCRHRVSADLRDGLKPVARKILFATFELGNRTEFPHTVKSAKIVGDTMGSYHSHGDSSIYGTMKPIANNFEINVPLLNKQGAWGNKFGDEAAAMRYTEAGLSKFSQEYLLGNLKETYNCVDWLDNFDSTRKEPEYLPAALPMVLINGTFGIAVGFKVEIPKHNLAEVVDATVRLIKNRDASVVLIPEHCMPCEIVDTDWETICNIGLGTYTVRGIIETGTHNGCPALFIKSAPDLIYYESIKNKIEKLIEGKKMINITEIHQGNSTDNDMIIVLKRGTDANYMKQLIYQYTDMEAPYRINFEVLDNMVPIRMSYKSYLLQWIEFAKFTKFRLYCNRVQIKNTRLHTIEPYVKMASSKDIEKIISIIRSKSMPDNELIEYLIKKLDITDLQAKFIIEIKLKQLSPMYFQSFIEEYNRLTEEVDKLMEGLTNDDIIEEDIIHDLLEAKKKYGEPRKCRVVSKAEASGIPSGEFRMVFTYNNFIKKLPMNDSISSFKGDAPKFIVKGDNAENLLIFNEMGKVFKLPISKIPFSDKRSNGIDIRLLLKNCGANVNAVLYEPIVVNLMKNLHKYFLVTLTKNGYIKKMDLDDFVSANNSGLIYAKLDSDDYIKDVMIIRDNVDVVVYSSNKAIRFPLSTVPYLKRATRGNRTLSEEVDGLSIINNETTDIIVVTRKGYINRFSPIALVSSDRISRSNKVIKLTKGDEILCVYGLKATDILVVTSTSGKINIPVCEVPMGSSIGTGSKMISNKTDTIVSCSFIYNK